MIVAKDVFENMLNSSIRHLRGRVEVFEGSTLASICGCHDRLIDFKVERVGEQGKFFGYGICQKLTVNLLDKNRELDINKKHSLEVEYGVESDYLYPYPSFHVETVKRDENTNNLTIEAYDALYAASAHTVAELTLEQAYTIEQFTAACAAVLGIPFKIDDKALESFKTYYATGANFEGTETIREALNAIAEATQTIYFINYNWELYFKRLEDNSEPVAIVDKTKYFSLDSKESYTITGITHATQLGDNLTASTGAEGVTQFVRDNPFWELREDNYTLVDNALAAIAGLTIQQFNCSWRGNYLLEIGDRIGLVTKDDSVITSFMLDDVISFNGSLSGTTKWDYKENEGETASNPTSLGEVIKQTYAKVDKANKQIDMVVSESSANKEAISALQLNTESISASVTSLEEATSSNINNINGEIETIKNTVEAKVTAEDVTIQVQEQLKTGIDEISINGKEFTFDNKGLTIEDINPDTNNVIKTTVSNNGMIVNANNTDVLTANDVGVQARNLQAVTYLMIGNNSRLEDYGYNRTGCFWIGG